MSFFSSCITQKRNAVQRAFAESQQHMAAGNYQEAINSYDAAYAHSPNEPDARENYIQTVEEIKTSADKSYGAKKFALSEEVYSVLSKNFAKFKSFEKSLSFNKAYLDHKIKDCRVARNEALAQNALKDGNFSGAIEICRRSVRSYPNDSLVQKKWHDTVTGIYQIAETAQADGNTILAGKAYVALLENAPLIASSLPVLSFSEESLKERLRKCRTSLTGKGLEQYRKGKLKEAIRIWQGILQFDPENTEIKKAIDNAKSHLKKLKKQTEKDTPLSGRISWT